MEVRLYVGITSLVSAGYEQLLRPVQVHRALPEEEGRVQGGTGTIHAVCRRQTEVGTPPALFCCLPTMTGFLAAALLWK